MPWPADLGVDLSRGFRALKVWFTLREHGTSAIGAAVLRNVRQAATLAANVAAAPDLELLAPTHLNIVCFRVHPEGLSDGLELDQLNRCDAVSAVGSSVLYFLFPVCSAETSSWRLSSAAWEFRLAPSSTDVSLFAFASQTIARPMRTSTP